MSNPQKEVMDALNNIVEWSRKRDVPPGEWIAPLQDTLMEKDIFSMGVKQMLFPLAIFDRHGKVELANDKFLEGTGLTWDEVKAGKVNIKHIEDFSFSEAVKLTLQGETHTVSDLKDPLRFIASKSHYETPDYKSAILFPVFSEEAPIRGVVLFLPFDYRPDNA